VIEGRERAHDPDHHRHGVRIAPEPAVQPYELLVHHGVVHDDVDELVLLLAVGQLPVQQQVADLEEIAVRRELLDRVAAIEQHALVAIDIGDSRAAARRGEEPGVIGEHPGFSVKRADVDDVRADAARQNGKLDRLAFCVGQRGLFRGAHGVSS
jgi:hypothetical protein